MAIVEVLKYNGKNNVFAWKYPSQELGTWTQVIVNESQEAVFVKEGKILDVLGAGRHTLSTENIPILSKLINLPFGGKSPFTAEIWYVNKAYSLEIKWGTPSPIQIEDAKYKVFIPVRAHGQFGIQIEDSKAFITKIVGTLRIFDEEELIKNFKGLIITKIKDIISTYLIEKQISVLEINSCIDDISEKMKEEIALNMKDYGIKIANFYVTSIDTPEEDSAVRKLKEALAKRAEMDIVGYNYEQERSFDTLESVAKNQGGIGNDILGAGIGLSMGMGIGNNIAAQTESISKNLETKNTDVEEDTCKKCGAQIKKGEKFCSECGEKLIIECKNCKHIIKEGQKFCPNCGEKQIILCPNCNKELETNQRFCPNCGRKLEEK